MIFYNFVQSCLIIEIEEQVIQLNWYLQIHGNVFSSPQPLQHMKAEKTNLIIQFLIGNRHKHLFAVKMLAYLYDAKTYVWVHLCPCQCPYIHKLYKLSSSPIPENRLVMAV